MIRTSVVVCLALGLMITAPVGAQAADRPPKLVLGMSTALSGPAAALGTSVRDGVQVAIAEANAGGGKPRRQLELVALDDGYEPAQAGPNMRRLIQEYKVRAIVGNMGTPTAVAAIPIAESSHIPFFGAYSGGGVLRREPPDKYVINFRASYAEETAAMVDALLDHAGLKVDEIAFFTQRDAYGDAGYAGGIAALTRRGLKDEQQVIHCRYERNTVVVEPAVADLLQADHPPRAVIMVGTFAPCARFVKLARASGLSPRFLTVSFVGTEPLAKALGADGDGVVVTQVVPHPGGNAKIAVEYRQALRSFGPMAEPGFGSFEGYAAMRVLLRALARVDGELAPDAIVAALEGLGSFDIGLGAPLFLDARHHQACHQVWPTVLRDGRAVEMQWTELGEK